MTIRLLLTGGTIDKAYMAHNGSLAFTETHMQEALRFGRCTVDVVTEPLLLKDSLEMTDDDRRVILTACEKSPEQQLVITHGTDTMVTTARVLAEARLDKVLVLTGAMIPYIMKDSDALFNLGGAVTAAQCLSVGVYIAINGEVFSWDNVEKDMEALQFRCLH